MSALSLHYDEAAHLAGYLTRLHAWDDTAVVRLQVRGRVVGVFGAPPMDCLTLLVIPLAAAADAGTDGLDSVVSAGRLRDVIGDVSTSWGVQVRSVPVPDAIGPRAEVAVLPPRSGWLPGERGIAGDVAPLVAAAVEQARARLEAEPDADDRRRREIADEVWSGPGWGGIPLPALHAARSLGLLSHDGLRLETATAPGWKRLSAPGGQVYVRTVGVPELHLTVLR